MLKIFNFEKKIHELSILDNFFKTFFNSLFDTINYPYLNIRMNTYSMENKNL